MDKTSKQSDSKTAVLITLLIVVCAAVLTAHWPVLSAQAIFIDDNEYITENPLVQNPGWRSARQIVTEVSRPSTVHGYYQPLAMISLMIDYALGGRADNLMPFHRTNIILHIMNTAMAALLLYLLFGNAPAAAGAALLFGLHPMTVEPVAWISDRKTLLAAFFALWCIILYVRSIHKNNRRSHIGCIILYVLALLSKPTSIPLPVLLLILDYWPLRRLKRQAVLEKIPLFVVGTIFAIITYISQSSVGNVTTPAEYGLKRIVLTLCHNIVFYLYKIAWPVNLSSHYAYPQPLSLSHPMILAGVVGTGILILLLAISLRWTPAALTGWLFFFAAILPTMGVVGFTIVIAADKFAYLPSMGLLIILAPLLGRLCGTKNAVKPTARCMAAAVLVLILAGAETAATRRQLMHWQDSTGLYEHILKLSPDAIPIHDMLGVELSEQGRLDEAISHFNQALRLKGDDADVHNNLGKAFQLQDRLDEAISHFRQALQIRPNYLKAHINLSNALSARGRFDEAVSHYRQALQLRPNDPDIHNNIANLLASQGRFDEAIGHYRQALQARPGDAEIHYNLGLALKLQGKLDEAIKHFAEALRIRPDFTEARKNLDAVITQQNKP